MINGNIIKFGSKGEIRKLWQKGIKIFIGIDDNKIKLKQELEQQDFTKSCVYI